jgi:hypothetical protein
MEEFAARYPSGIIVLNVLEGRGALPPSDARERIARDMKHHEQFTRALVLIYEGKGFLAASARAIIVGLQTLSRQKAPMKVCASVEEAASWLSGQLRGGTREQLVAAVAEVRQMENRDKLDGM